MRRDVWPAVFALLVGAGMVAQWTLSLVGGGVAEVETRPVELGFHLAAEGTTALLLVVAGLGLLRRAGWAWWLYCVATGMLLYTAIVSPGYFVQEGQPAYLALFVVILALALVFLALVVRSRRPSG